LFKSRYTNVRIIIIIIIRQKLKQVRQQLERLTSKFLLAEETKILCRMSLMQAVMGCRTR